MNWYLTSKLALYITLSYEGHNINAPSGRYLDGCGCFPDGRMPENINDIADHFNVEAFADTAAEIGVEYVNFTLYHAHLYTLCPNHTLEQRLPGHTSRRDVIRELLDALHRRGIRLQLYIHATVGDTMTDEERKALNWYDSADHYRKWNDFFCAFFDELGSRYGTDMDSYYLDMIFDQPYMDMIDKQRIRDTLKKHNPNVIVTGNGEANDTVDYSSREDCSLYVPDAFARMAYPVQTVILLSPKWWSTVPQWRESVARYAPGHLYKTLMLTASANTCGGGMAIGCGVYCDGSFEPGIAETLKALGRMIDPIAESVKNTLPSSSYPTASGSTIRDLPFGVAATRSSDDAYEYLHVLKPLNGDALSLPVPLDGKIFSEAVLLPEHDPLEFSQTDAGVRIVIPPNRDNLVVRLTVLRKPETPTYAVCDVQPVSVRADDALDGHEAACVLRDDNSFWLTSPACFHDLTFDLGESRPVCGLRMLPRQEGDKREPLVTHINAYSVFVSDDAERWRCACTGEWKRSEALKHCVFPAISARYVRLLAGPDWLLEQKYSVSSARRIWIECVDSACT